MARKNKKKCQKNHQKANGSKKKTGQQTQEDKGI